MEPHFSDDLVTLYAGDCLTVLAGLPDCSVDAVVTDPPYGLEFMGKDWDAPWKAEYGSKGAVIRDPAKERGGFQDGSGGNPFSRSKIEYGRGGSSSPLFQAWCEQWARECLRILKPGGYLLAFGGTRTYHRLACGVEDAGFEIRDSIAWLYGSGFPKSMDVSKAIDAAAGAEREVISTERNWGKSTAEDGKQAYGDYAGEWTVTEPATEDAKQWRGWGTALKPAMEPVVVGRKPMIGTVAANVQEFGTGALNIDGCRVPHASAQDLEKHAAGVAAIKQRGGSMGNSWKNSSDLSGANDVSISGRWPANVLLDESAATELDRQSGASKPTQPQGGEFRGRNAPVNYGDEGGASRFFPVFRYEAKASTAERPSENGVTHPTVKPVDLMRWLIRLVTPPGGVVLDPFAGSGTTGEAAIHEHKRAILVEREPDYLPLIVNRLSKPMEVGFDF